MGLKFSWIGFFPLVSPSASNPIFTAMEAPQLAGDAEGCSSSESGWTMYLASPMHDNGDSDGHDAVEGDEDDDDDDDDSGNNNSSGGKDEGDEDDDSMASDASTGPAHNKNSYRKGDGIKVKHGEENDGNCSQYSSHPCRMFPRMEKTKDRETKRPFQRKAGSTSSQSNSKARKTNLNKK